MSAIVEVTLDEIQRHLSTYIQRVEAGETLVILKAGEPVAELRPIVSGSPRLRPSGLCAGEFTVPDDFDAPLPDYIVEEIETHKHDRVREALDDVYAEESSSLDEALAQMQWASLSREDW